MMAFVEGDGMTGSGQLLLPNPAGPARQQRSDGDLMYASSGHCLVAARIDQARCDLLFEDLIKAGLIAADARVDFIVSVGLGFDDQVGISEERPHRNQVRTSLLALLTHRAYSSGWL